MKVERKKWIAVGTLAALGLGVGSAVAVPALNTDDRPDTAVVESTQQSSSKDSATANESADRSATADSDASANSPASANSLASANSPASANRPASANSPASAKTPASATGSVRNSRPPEPPTRSVRAGEPHRFGSRSVAMLRCVVPGVGQGAGRCGRPRQASGCAFRAAGRQ